MRAARQWVGVIALALASVFGAGLPTNADAEITFRNSATAWVPNTAPYSPIFVGAGAVTSAVSGDVDVPLPTFGGKFFICVIESRDNMPSTMPAGWNLLREASGA